ncbi:MAG: heterodisulfide reductase-related iron-sulfur binding cluster [Aeromicrobium sp.]
MIAVLVGSVDGETREVFEDFSTTGKMVFYVLSTAAIAVFMWGWWRRVAKYRHGRPARRTTRIDSLYTIASNSSVARRDLRAGVAHFFIFWGFITLFIGTVILTIDEDIVRVASRQFGEERSFFKGVFYVVYSLVLDTMGIAFLVALGYMALRRWVGHKPALDYARAEQPDGGYSRRSFKRGDRLFVGSLALILLTGFLHEGLRIRASEFPDFEIWSPVGWLIAKAVRSIGIGAGTADTWRLDMWWVHAVAALAFVAYIPFSKAMHMVTDAANLVTYDPSTSRNLPAPTPSDDGAHLGLRVIGDFTWKQLLDLDACTKCGRCHVACPAAASGAPLSPRDLILDLRQWAEGAGRTFTMLDHESRPVASGPLATNGTLAGGVVPAETLWACTTCMACVEACPVGIEHVPTIVALRRSLVEEGSMEPSLQDALQNIAQKGNSFGKSGRQRARWTKALDFTITDARTEPVRYLWFVGDFASFDERLQEVSQTVARILHEAGVSFGILYEDERNAGNDVRRVGEEGLFEMLREQNLEVLAKAQFEEIFTTDPHTLNTLRNEYPLDVPVRHYTEVFVELLRSSALQPAALNMRATYHDPCYLGRYNDVTEAPRELLRAIGCDIVEMPRNRQNSFCCGAGGGRIWMDDSGLTERPSENRIREASTLDVELFVVSCPKDFTMYTDAAKTVGCDDRLKVADIAQLLDSALHPLVAMVDS